MPARTSALASWSGFCGGPPWIANCEQQASTAVFSSKPLRKPNSRNASIVFGAGISSYKQWLLIAARPELQKRWQPQSKIALLLPLGNEQRLSSLFNVSIARRLTDFRVVGVAAWSARAR